MSETVGSLCSGYGGLDMAVGGKVLWVADNDRDASTILAERFPGVPNLGDITAVDWKEINRMGAHRNEVLAQSMYDRYCQGLSLAEVAEEFGRSRQTVWKMFERRGWDMRTRPPARPRIEFGGRIYSIRDNGYYAATDGEREYLHRDVWESANGPLPDDWDVHHADHDKTNNVLANLRAMPKAEHSRLHGAEEVMPNEDPAVDTLTAGYP